MENFVTYPISILEKLSVNRGMHTPTAEEQVAT
jgi:hypothetical protein